jgi:hypothetical protein
MLVPIPALIIIEAHSPSKRSMSLSIVRLAVVLQILLAAAVGIRLFTSSAAPASRHI